MLPKSRCQGQAVFAAQISTFPLTPQLLETMRPVLPMFDTPAKVLRKNPDAILYFLHQTAIML